MHKSVLLEESITNLHLKEDSIIVDCTLGYGGHSSEILKQIPKGFLYAFDQDSEAIAYSEKRLQTIASNYEIIKSNFVNLQSELQKRNRKEVDGLLFDLGVSSPQLDEEQRGFSFHKDAKLDMRMNQESSFSAYDVVNTYAKEELIRIFRDYGEEKYASSIASHIVESRQEKNIETTLELVEIIKKSVPEKYKREKHPARKVFQAIRIEVNHELEVLESALEQALQIVKVGGRICVITFHSLEDRICKNKFRQVSEVDVAIAKLPVIPEQYLPNYKYIKTKEASHQELEENYRARSAKLRVIERIK